MFKCRASRRVGENPVGTRLDDIRSATGVPRAGQRFLFQDVPPRSTLCQGPKWFAVSGAVSCPQQLLAWGRRPELRSARSLARDQRREQRERR